MTYFQGATLVLGRVGYIGDYMTQLYIGIVPSHDEDPVINRSRLHGMLKGLFASRCSGFYLHVSFLLKMLLSLFVSTDEMQHIMIHLGNVRDFLISSGNFLFLQNSMAQKNRHPN